MKVKKMGKKLVIIKKTVAHLNEDDMKRIKGGLPEATYAMGFCPSTPTSDS